MDTSQPKRLYSVSFRTTKQRCNKSDWKHEKIEEKKKGDSLFIKSLPTSLKNIGIELLAHIRDLHPSGTIIENRDENRYTNYLINQESYYRKDSWNFVSFVPQKDCIKVFVLNGDYGFLSRIKLNEDDRYSYFKISSSFQLADAKDAIELSYFYFMGWVE